MIDCSLVFITPSLLYCSHISHKCKTRCVALSWSLEELLLCRPSILLLLKGPFTLLLPDHTSASASIKDGPGAVALSFNSTHPPGVPAVVPLCTVVSGRIADLQYLSLVRRAESWDGGGRETEKNKFLSSCSLSSFLLLNDSLFPQVKS